MSGTSYRLERSKVFQVLQINDPHISEAVVQDFDGICK